ncbi:hypothetical protein [Asticcacaulis sp. YBE204]|uniref:hypothetical protein n=1 Tax=Asticcacaulis sp. YBE204 TaxID=1282363 RepID=UPI0003C3B7D3|nr:hypothetical protein [Asticcacaulis sp. YBE204]ESQ76991.1 hypothetical protein AEYBE204_18045 [Asticcacaulis sp. YBE204]
MPGKLPDLVFETPVWALWQRLTPLFPGWSLIPSAFVTPGAWTMMGVDFVSGLRRNGSTRKAFELLAGVDAAIFAAIVDLATLNEKRQEHILKAVIIGYLTIPLSVIALLAEIAGDSVSCYAREHTTAIIQWGCVLTAAPAGYFLSHWRSKQIVSVLELIRIERGDVVAKPSGATTED